MDTGSMAINNRTANWLNVVASTSRRQCVADTRRRSADKRRVGAAIDRRATMIGGTKKAAERKGQDRTERWRRR